MSLLPVIAVFAEDNDQGGGSSYLPDLAQILVNLQKSLPAVIQLVVAIAYVMGLTFIFTAVHELRVYGQARTMIPTETSLAAPLGRMAIGALLLFLPGMIDVSVYTLWNHSVYNVQAYFQPGSEDWANQVFDSVIALVRVFGYISIVHGLAMLSRVVKRGAAPGQFGKGMIHIIGGVLGVNIVETTQIIMSTFFQA